jgi:hypothetical protein
MCFQLPATACPSSLLTISPYTRRQPRNQELPKVLRKGHAIKAAHSFRRSPRGEVWLGAVLLAAALVLAVYLVLTG